jgi:hypothetical protein
MSSDSTNKRFTNLYPELSVLTYGDQSYSAFRFLVVIASIVAENYIGNIL